MKTIGILKNTIQEYAWGSRDAIAKLLGEKAPSENPQAELWMGAHPKAPSLVRLSDRWVSLDTLLDQDPVGILGQAVSKRFNGKLPFLFKVLSAAQPLSIQAHPSLAQAQKGFDRENRLGIPIDAQNRNYRDANHKPECICALAPFWAMVGFRKPRDIIALMEAAWPEDALPELKPLRGESGPDGMKHFYQAIMKIDDTRKQHLIGSLIDNIHLKTDLNSVFEWVSKLYDAYPSDMGVLSPMILNLIRLKPGQALFLPAGMPHAYLEGLGIELMANSDNVLRGGLTNKHIDIPELMQTLEFRSGEPEILLPKKISECELRYFAGSAEFELSRLVVKNGRVFTSAAERSVELLICVEGEAVAEISKDHQTIQITKGVSVIVPASIGAYSMKGNAQLYKAGVPLK